MTDQGVVVFGIPIPSSSPVFLGIVAVHVAAGLICSVTGIVAMLAPKRSGRHPSAGTVYYWGLLVVFLSMAALSILRWPADTHLFVLGVLSFGAGVIGRMAKRRLWPGGLRVHVIGMAISYILLLTAFYVDNGPHLPLWRLLPPLAYWLLPSVVGLPILIWVLTRHPLILHSRIRSVGLEGITVVATLMILFGVAEVFTGFFLGHHIGVSEANSTVFVYEGPAIGALYIIGGSLLLTGKRWAAGLAAACLVADVAGRVHLVVTGVYPFIGLAAVAGVIGTAIAICFGIYIAWKWRLFT